MERRKAITTAAAASLTLLAGAAGIALNSGIVGASGDGNVGQISPVATTADPLTTVYIDEPAGPTAAAPAPAVRPTDAQPDTTSAASGYQDDDDRYEREGEDDEETSQTGGDLDTRGVHRW